jgi:predicted MFS family arabinose efflux permease
MWFGSTTQGEHQVGSSLGAWGGGLIFDTLGSYDRAWQLGIAPYMLARQLPVVSAEYAAVIRSRH